MPLITQGKYGPQALYLPHIFRDIISIGSSCGDKEYYSTTLNEVLLKITNKNGLNLDIVGGLSTWTSHVKSLIFEDHSVALNKHYKQLQLPELEDHGLPYTRMDSYWNYFG